MVQRPCLPGAMVIACLKLARVRDEVQRIIHTESSGGIRPTAKIQSVSNTFYLPLKCKMLSEFINSAIGQSCAVSVSDSAIRQSCVAKDNTLKDNLELVDN